MSVRIYTVFLKFTKKVSNEDNSRKVQVLLFLLYANVIRTVMLFHYLQQLSFKDHHRDIFSEAIVTLSDSILKASKSMGLQNFTKRH